MQSRTVDRQSSGRQFFKRAQFPPSQRRYMGSRMSPPLTGTPCSTVAGSRQGRRRRASTAARSHFRHDAGVQVTESESQDTELTFAIPSTNATTLTTILACSCHSVGHIHRRLLVYFFHDPAGSPDPAPSRPAGLPDDGRARAVRLPGQWSPPSEDPPQRPPRAQRQSTTPRGVRR